MVRDGASYRDPAGHVYFQDERVLRTVSHAALAAFEEVNQRPVIERLRSQGRLISACILPKSKWPAEAAFLDPAPAALIEHEHVTNWTYPYEWPFEALRAAALAHLDLHTDLLADGITLSDASAYNIQLVGTRPVFIDALSIRPYVEGEYWLGHDQFLRQFLNPLLLEAVCGVSYAGIYRGNHEGLTSRDLAQLMPVRAWGRPALLLNVMLPGKLAEKAGSNPYGAMTIAERIRRPLPKKALCNLLNHLRRIVARLKANRPASAWSGYAVDNSYSAEGQRQKEAFVREFVAHARPGMLVDIGCNDGAYSRSALESGATAVIGLDTDRASLDCAFLNAQNESLQFLPLYADLADPSPAQGWLSRERRAFVSRLRGDALIALAVIHHLAIGRNLPLAEVVKLLIELAPQGVIEFVPKSDPMIEIMLAGREDIFHDYGEEQLRCYLLDRARIVREVKLPDSARRLIWYSTKF